MGVKALLVYKTVLLLLASTTISLVFAQNSRDVNGASDSILIERFAGSRIVSYVRDPSHYYRLALGRMQRANGNVSPSSQEQIQGSLTRITYEISEGFSGPQVFEYFERQLRQRNVIPLFRCEGRDCGSSNFWANDVFDNRILYGPVTDQFYLAAKIADTANRLESYVALYVITRGNRRVYAHIDFVEPSLPAQVEAPVTAAALSAGLLERGAVVIPSLNFDDSDGLTNAEPLKAVVEMLRTERLMRVYIVGHLQEQQPLEDLVMRSELRAQSVRQSLLSSGIDSGRLMARGVGPLAPHCDRTQCEQRIELVLMP
jgi:hypothetical protein